VNALEAHTKRGEQREPPVRWPRSDLSYHVSGRRILSRKYDFKSLWGRVAHLDVLLFCHSSSKDNKTPADCIHLARIRTGPRVAATAIMTKKKTAGRAVQPTNYVANVPVIDDPRFSSMHSAPVSVQRRAPFINIPPPIPQPTPVFQDTDSCSIFHA
jgi:hypothetical protein